MNKYWYVESDLSINQKETEQKDGQSSTASWGEKKVELVIVTLIPNVGKMSQIVLPINPEGRYSFDFNGSEKVQKSIYVQGGCGKWFLHSIKPMYLHEEGKGLSTLLELHDEQIVQVKNADINCIIITQFVEKDFFASHNYKLLNKKITIGSALNNDIVYKSKFVENRVAELTYSGGRWKILRMTNNISMMVNGESTQDKEVSVGDVIYVMGLRVIIGTDFISVNDGNKLVYVNKKNLSKIENAREATYFVSAGTQSETNEPFNRMPRRRMPMNEPEIQIDSPPMSLNGDRIPLMLRMGGSMVMGATSLFAGNPTMMISSVLFPILNSKYTEKQKKEYEERRTTKYLEYLDRKRLEIEKEKEREEVVLNHNYPELQEVLSFVKDGNRLWERRKIDDDFLNIRIGEGDVPLVAKLQYNEERFSLEEDPMEDKMYELVNQKIQCHNAPIMNSFINNYICGILGLQKLSESFLKRLIMQIVLTHSYDEVKLVFLINKSDFREFDYIRYLPHTWNDEKSFRFIATNQSEAYQLSKVLREELGEDLNNISVNSFKLAEGLRKRPYYFVLALDKKLFDSVEVFKDLMQLDRNMGVSILIAFDDLPKECYTIFNLQTSGHHIMTQLRELDKEDVVFKMDRYDEMLAKQSIGTISNTRLQADSVSAMLPKTLLFLEMFGVGKVEHLNSALRWKENNPVRSLATPVGVGADGSQFILDIHQNYHGPHGLIAGMTGSGKSEFIITYILSLAVNYHPDEVAFLLIDYKGGGLTTAFEDPVRGVYLPHLMGTITNLDGAAINRSLISIQSEITRRQRLFKEAKGIVEDTTIDIYSYQKLYREGLVKEALPHLLIIADEFAEMKQQEPEFMDSLISIARIGRSLGVHLILATQKPSGIVNDQIRSNTKFRVCLKVQDKSDSMDMLKRPEGAEIKAVGRFYLQVGYNEFFALGQSAWTGADYEPQEELVVQRDDSVVFIDTLGQSIREEKPIVKKDTTGKSELSEVVRYLVEVAEAEGFERKLLWSEPLPRIIDNSEVVITNEKNKVNVYLGEVDDPARQKQFSYIYDVSNSKNLLIAGGNKSGKTTLIQSILLQLTLNYRPDDVNYYILDYSSHMLKLFNTVPHCGAVLSEDDVKVVPKLFDLIEQLMGERRQLFKQLEVDSFKNAREKTKIPVVLVVIDNISGLQASKETEQIYYRLNLIIKESTNFGIYFVLSCAHLNEVAVRIRQEIGDNIAFDMKDRYEYADFLGCNIFYIPQSIPGRGLVNMNGEGLEFHAAMYGANILPSDRTEHIKKVLMNLNDCDSGFVARRLPSFSNNETYEDFSRLFDRGRIPLGYSLETAKPVALPLKQFKSLAIYFGQENSKSNILKNLLYRAHFEKMHVTIFKKCQNSYFDQELKDDVIEVIECDKEILYNCIKGLLTSLMESKKYLEEYCAQKGVALKDAIQANDFRDKTFSHMYKNTKPHLIIIESVKDLYECSDNELSVALNGLCMMGPLYNTYILHLYEPGDCESVKDTAVRRVLSRDEMELLFGGNYGEQDLITVDYQYIEKSKNVKYNQGLMQYHGKTYGLLMPCGEIPGELVDVDDAPIF